MTNLAHNLTATAERYGARPAVRLDDVVLTYDELLGQSRRVTSLLRSRGVVPGDRVALVLPNVAQFPALRRYPAGRHQALSPDCKLRC